MEKDDVKKQSTGYMSIEEAKKRTIDKIRMIYSCGKQANG